MSQPDPDRPTAAEIILALEARRCGAMLAGDAEALEALLSDDLVYIHSSAKVDDKPGFINALRSGRTRYTALAPAEVRVRLYGDATAIVTGLMRARVVRQGVPGDFVYRFTAVWTRIARDEWRFASWQATPVAAG